MALREITAEFEVGWDSKVLEEADQQIKATIKGLKELGRIIRGTGLSKQAKEATKEMGKLGRGAGRAATQVTKAVKKVEDLEKASKEAGEAADNAADDLKDMGDAGAKGAKKAEGEVSTLGGTLKKLAAGAAAVFAVGQVKDFITETTEMGREMITNAEAMGLATDRLDGLKAVAEESGSDFDTLLGGMRGLNDYVQDAIDDPKSEAGDLFKSIGLDPDSLKNMDIQERFTSFAGAMSQVTDEQTRMGLASRAMGDDAYRLGILLGTSREELEGMTEAARQNSAFNSENTATLKAAARQQARLTRAWEDFKTRALVALVPWLLKIEILFWKVVRVIKQMSQNKTAVNGVKALTAALGGLFGLNIIKRAGKLLGIMKEMGSVGGAIKGAGGAGTGGMLSKLGKGAKGLASKGGRLAGGVLRGGAKFLGPVGAIATVAEVAHAFNEDPSRFGNHSRNNNRSRRAMSRAREVQSGLSGYRTTSMVGPGATSGATTNQTNNMRSNVTNNFYGVDGDPQKISDQASGAIISSQEAMMSVSPGVVPQAR